MAAGMDEGNIWLRSLSPVLRLCAYIVTAGTIGQTIALSKTHL